VSERGQNARLRRARCAAAAEWRWIYRLGSLRLAMILLFTVAAACAVATVCESRFNRQVAEAYIYKNPFFMLWLSLLCLNLICSVLTRWPWKRKQLGFVVTHSGIITLLAGAVIGHFFGLEAWVNLEKDAPPVNMLTVSETALMVRGFHSGEFYQAPLTMRARRPTPRRPRVIPVPESDLRLQILAYRADLAGIQARLADADGATGEAEWIAAGTSRLLRAGAAVVQVGFGPRQVPLPFSVALDDFRVPRDEGTDQPANFISELTFSEAGGVTRRERVEMNHPASFPGGWWRLATGLNYKFSQAGWDPTDLNRTTLQVLYDPGWLCKWLGSLLICGGITLMFYCRPRGTTKRS
jgi:hypothetical protein